MENKAQCKRFHQLNKERQLLEAFLNDAPDCLVDNQSSTTTNQCDATSSEIVLSSIDILTEDVIWPQSDNQFICIPFEPISQSYDSEQHSSPSDSNSDFCYLSDRSSIHEDETGYDIEQELVKWAKECSISNNSLSKLLVTLQPVLPVLPLTASTLYKNFVTLSASANISDSGEYAFFSLKELLIEKLKSGINDCHHGSYHDELMSQGNTHQKILTIKINIDGVPLFKSSKTNLWPISQF